MTVRWLGDTVRIREGLKVLKSWQKKLDFSGLKNGGEKKIKEINVAKTYRMVDFFQKKPFDQSKDTDLSLVKTNWLILLVHLI